jgi:N-acetylglucosamine kinase-like BadF-type ATPase
VSAAARSEDGRGPRTALEALVPAHFELDTPTELAEAIHRGRIPQRRVVELAPVVLAAAADDAVAAEIVARLEDEIATMALTAIRRLDLDGPIEVLLGGGLVRAAGQTLVDAVAGALAADGTLVDVRACALPPIAGAALLGLDRLEATEDAKARLRDEIAAAMEEVAVG